MSRPEESDRGPDTRYPSLDFWRGIACLLVVVNHSSFMTHHSPGDNGWWPRASYFAAEIAGRMWIGVPIFFVISGYCIAATADSANRKGTGWKTFAVRRIRRIYPPFWVCLGLSAVAVVTTDVFLCPNALSSEPPLMLRPWWFSARQWVGNLTLTEVWLPHLLGHQKGLFLGHTWTLCYEEQFYVVMGLLLLVARRRLFVAAAAVTVLCPVAVAVLNRCGMSANGFFFDGQWLLFACGLLSYYAVNYASRRGQLAAAAVFAVMIGYCLWDPATFVDHLCRLPADVHPYDVSLFVAASFAAFVTLARPLDPWVRTRWWLRPVFACGRMCYSLYLVHLPLVLVLAGVVRYFGTDLNGLSPFVTVPVGLAVSVSAGALFYRLVERHFLNLPQPAPGTRPPSEGFATAVAPSRQPAQDSGVEPQPAIAP